MGNITARNDNITSCDGVKGHVAGVIPAIMMCQFPIKHCCNCVVDFVAGYL